MFPEPKPLVPSGPLNLLPSDEESFLCLNHFVFNQISPGLHITQNKLNFLDLAFTWYRYSAQFYNPNGAFIPLIAIFCNCSDRGFVSVFFLTKEPLMPPMPGQYTKLSAFKPASTAVLKQITPQQFPFNVSHVGEILGNQFNLLKDLFYYDLTKPLSAWWFHEPVDKSLYR
jgi:hypothetical protein